MTAGVRSVGAAVTPTLPTLHEQGYAVLAVMLLRENGVSDADIARHYTGPDPRADRAYERQILRDDGLVIAAGQVKAHMRRLVTH